MRRSILLVIATLGLALLSVLAHAVTGTLTYNITSGAGTVACDLGPNYIGSIPAGAQAAGFTHCAGNYDFTQSTPFTYMGQTVTWSNTPIWLQCTGQVPANPLWYGYSENGPTTPCSDYPIMIDNNGDAGASGGQVLGVIFTQADFNNNVQVTNLATANNQNYPNPAGTSFPNGAYLEWVARMTNATYASHQPKNYFFNLWESSPQAQWVEFDQMEIFGTGVGAGAGFGEHGCNGSFGCPGYPALSHVSDSSITTWDPTKYQNYGWRWTHDANANFGACVYWNGTQIPPQQGGTRQPCDSGSYFNGVSDPAFTSQRNQLIIWSGPNENSTTANCSDDGVNLVICNPPAGGNVTLVQRVTVWVPPSCIWQTQPCITTVDVGAP